MSEPDASRIELSREQMRELGYRVVDLLTEHFAAMSDSPVGAKANANEIWDRFAAEPGDDPRNPLELLDQIEKEVLPNNLHVDHPRFFAFVPGPNNFVSAMADALAAGFNVFNGTWLGGSAAAAVEMSVIGWFCRWCNLPERAGGLFVSGGSAANETALVAARHAILEDRSHGAVVYFSDQTHSSVERALRVIGFTPDQLRIVPCDDKFQLPIDRLHTLIEVDRAAGLVPFCVVANAGTTNTGAVDPLSGIADLCASEKMWMHVDGAYGAATMLSERGRSALAGLERADSLSLDPHKWMFQSFECGCVLLRDRDLLKAAFRITPDYLRDVHRHVAEVNFCDYGIQLTRSFRSLKVWLSFQTFGLRAFREAITRGFQLAEFAEAELRKRRKCEVLSPAQMGIVCFRFGQKDVTQSEIVERMLRDKFAFLTSTSLRGVTALRLCTINPRTTRDDIVATIDRVERFARELTSDL
ncbi:MAG: pyridoxal phosphate-dependent decarboxylase family protein [Chthoniobacterales bacterium]